MPTEWGVYKLALAYECDSMCSQRLLKKVVVRFVITYELNVRRVFQSLFPFIDRNKIGMWLQIGKGAVISE